MTDIYPRVVHELPEHDWCKCCEHDLDGHGNGCGVCDGSDSPAVCAVCGAAGLVAGKAIQTRPEPGWLICGVECLHGELVRCHLCHAPAHIICTARLSGPWTFERTVSVECGCGRRALAVCDERPVAESVCEAAWAWNTEHEVTP